MMNEETDWFNEKSIQETLDYIEQVLNDGAQRSSEVGAQRLYRCGYCKEIGHNRFVFVYLAEAALIFMKVLATKKQFHGRSYRAVRANQTS